MGKIFKIPGVVLWFAGGFWGLFISIGIIVSKLGVIAGVIAFVLLPATLYLAPWYAGFVDGNWFPAMVVYGTSIGAIVLITIGRAVDGDV